MERIERKPFQGVLNIVRFNWHFYWIAIAVIALLFVAEKYLPAGTTLYLFIFLLLAILGILLSLVASWYIYDRSELYTLNWLSPMNFPAGSKIVNIHAGFDETSALLQQRYPAAELEVFDFYDPELHTEDSIERARKAYPPYKGAKTISTHSVPLQPGSSDGIFLILAAHEIRDKQEQVLFFKQLERSLKKNGKVVVLEHSRDLPNFLVYSIGFFHFFSKGRWQRVFLSSGLEMERTFMITPFITAYILGKKNGAAS